LNKRKSNQNLELEKISFQNRTAQPVEMGKMELMTSMDSFPSKTYTQSHVQRMTICPAAANNSLTPREVNKKNAAILELENSLVNIG
jgi:hypothetical protein